MAFPQLGGEDSPDELKNRYDHCIGGEYVPPAKGSTSRTRPGDRRDVLRGRPGHRRGRRAGARRRARGRGRVGPHLAPPSARTSCNKIADRIEANLEMLAVAETLGERQAGPRDAGRRHPAGRRPLPLLRRARSARRRARISQIDEDTVAYHFHEPLGVVGADHPVELPDPHGHLEARPGAGRGQRVVLKPAEQTPASILLRDRAGRRPAAAGRAQHRQRLRRRGRQAARVEPPGGKIAFTGETTTGRLIMQYASREPDPGHAGARRQEPEHLLRRRRAPTTTSTTRRSRASRCSRSTRARSAPARRGR